MERQSEVVAQNSLKHLLLHSVDSTGPLQPSYGPLRVSGLYLNAGC